jgi:hypothetical protein
MFFFLEIWEVERAVQAYSVCSAALECLAFADPDSRGNTGTLSQRLPGLWKVTLPAWSEASRP